MNLLSKFLLSFSNSFIVSITGFLFYSFLSKNMLANEYGSFSIILSLITFFISAGTFGMHLISSKELKNDASYNNLHFINLLKLSLISIPISIAGFFIIASTIDVPIFSDSTYIVLSFFILFSVLQKIICDIFRSNNNLFFFFSLNSIGSGAGIFFWIFSLSSVIYLINSNSLELYSIFLILMLGSLIPLLFAILFHYKNLFKFCKNFILSFKNSNFQAFLSTSFKIYLTVFFRTFKENFLIVFLWIFSSEVDSGIFFNIYKSLFVVIIPMMIVDQITPQIIAKLLSKNISDLQFFSKNISTLRFILSFLTFLPLYFFAEEFLLTMFGPLYAENYLFLRFILIAYVLGMYFGISYSILLFSSQNKFLITADAIIIFFVTLISIVLIKSYGLLGAIISFCLLILLSNIIYYIICLKIMKVNTLVNLRSFDIKYLSNYIS